MKKIIYLAIRFFGSLSVLFAVWLGSLVTLASFTQYRPKRREALTTIGNEAYDEESDAVKSPISKRVLRLVSWNIGYGGLGEESDFFYDDGKMIHPKKEWVTKNIAGINQFLRSIEQQTDFILLQEIDIMSSRTYFMSQLSAFEEVLSKWNYTLAINYNVQFIPYPFYRPLGKILSGIITYGRYQPLESWRYKLASRVFWPKSLFFLKRCFLLQRYKVVGGKELILINIHNSAYDNGDLKAKQLEQLKKVALEEYHKGNYVIIGGDWNQCPPNFDKKTFLYPAYSEQYIKQTSIDSSYLVDWKWVYDRATPSSRSLEQPYDENISLKTIIDMFLISPNINIIKKITINQDFAFSDHHPLLVTLELK